MKPAEDYRLDDTLLDTVGYIATVLCVVLSIAGLFLWWVLR